MGRIGVLGMMVAIVMAGRVAAQSGVDLKTDQYKRVHRRAMRAVSAGDLDAVIEALEAYGAEHPEDPETWYVLAAAHIRQGKLVRAMECVKEAVSRGLPIERFVAGPRDLLRPLVSRVAFQEYARGRLSPLLHGPLLGRVTDSAAGVWVRTADEADVRVRLTPDSKGGVRIGEGRTTAAEDFTTVVDVDGLEPDTAYTYTLAIDGKTLEDPGWTFRTMLASGQAGALRVGFGGGAGYVPPHERVWETILRFEPRAFLFLGDNVYIDTPKDPAVQDYIYYRRQSRPEYRAFLGATPVYAIWDDHDFGDNDCWGGPEIETPAWKRPVWERFRRQWANPSYGGGEALPGCWFTWQAGDVDFFFLDCRYYRTNPKRKKTSMLGPRQLDWLLGKLKASDGTFKVIVSSVPWARGTKPGSKDTWDGYDTERETIFSCIEANRLDGVVLLSADRHRSDVWKIERKNGYDFYEFESSRLTNQHVHKKIPGAEFSYNESQSFGLLDFDTAKPDPTVTYRIVNIDGEVVHTVCVARSQLTSPR
ncbi:MAG: tetratricopeptide repeat protein [Nitrospiraceae bacterium]|nr:tetratricopeptide repeat protein [Nitrospiraceae bacterium]